MFNRYNWQTRTLESTTGLPPDLEFSNPMMTTNFYRIIFCILFWYKKLNIFCPCVWGVLCGVQDICACERCSACILSARDVTKHGDRSPSPTGVNWVSDGVGIDFTEYMRCKGVCLFGSLKWTIIIDFWERNGAIPVRTKLLLLSNRLQGFWWDRTVLN